MKAIKIIVREPGLWDSDCIECPFADQDNVCCLAYALGGGNVIYCSSDGNAENCPLNDGPVTVSMGSSDGNISPLRPPGKDKKCCCNPEKMCDECMECCRINN